MSRWNERPNYGCNNRNNWRLSASWRERPHVTLTTEADATNLVSARQQLAEELGQKVAYDALLVALVARALREQPGINARLTERGIEEIAEAAVVPVKHDIKGVEPDMYVALKPGYEASDELVQKIITALVTEIGRSAGS